MKKTMEKSASIIEGMGNGVCPCGEGCKCGPDCACREGYGG